jgi:hypothetical protein
MRIARELTGFPHSSFSRREGWFFRTEKEVNMTNTITIRHATEADRRQLLELASLDSRPAPEGASLLAFVDGELRAALPLDGGAAVADPFHLNDQLVELLRLRAGQQPDGALAPARRLLGRLLPGPHGASQEARA